jgi:dynamin 1-like protein
MERVVGLVNRLQQICTQLGDTAGNSILVDKLSSIVVVGGQVRSDSWPSAAQQM